MAKPKNCISVEKARELQNNWISTRAVHLEKGQGALDHREVMFSLADLEEYLEYVKSESAKQGIDSPGIRVYFAAYDHDDSDKATVFLAPAKGTDVNADNNYQIDSFNWGVGGLPPNNY
ncbi:MAG: hypothetical protein ACI86C_000891 [Candidatus Latescibacterota bacterium]|jgi:hypothetical protein